MAVTATSLVLGVGLSFLSSILFKPKVPKSNFRRDNKPTTLTERGAYADYVMGTRRVGSVFTWAGRRKVVKKKSSGGSKGGGGRSTVTGQVYFEAGMHVLCVGPAFALNRIWANGKVLYDTRITRNDTASGIEVIVKAGGKQGNGESFKIYWGDIAGVDEHPLDTDLSPGDAFGFESRWPALCHVVWIQKRLGNSPTWPQIEYEIEVRPPAGLLSNSSEWLIQQLGDGDRGANPAHAIMHLLTAEWPRGMGIASANIATDLLEDVGAIAQNEHLPVNFKATGGESGATILAELLQDVGLTMVQAEGKLAFKAIREELVVPDLSDDVICPPVPETTILLGAKPASKANFVYEDNQIAFKDRVFTLDDDSVIQVKDKKIDMPTVTSQSVAARVADRRQVEELANVRQYKWIAKRAARLLSPGQVFSRNSVIYRIMSVSRKTLEPDVVHNTVIDIYGDSFSGYQPIISRPPDQVEGIAPDDPVAIFEPTFDFTQGQPRVSVLRVAANQQVENALVNLSLDDISYLPSGEQKIEATAGILDEVLLSSAAKILEDGPLVTFTDVTDILDLSANEAEWKLGVQQMIIGDENFFLRNIEFVSGEQYRLKGLIRARRGTDEEDHAVNDQVWIYRTDDQKLLASELIQNGITIFAKTQPENQDDAIDLSLVTAVSRLLTGRWNAPYNPDNFRVNNSGFEHRNRYSTGQAIQIFWHNRTRDGNGLAAGEALSGTAMETVTTMDAVLRIRATDMADVEKIAPFDISTGLTTSITNGDLTTGFGGEPAQFKLKYRQFDDTFFAAEREIIVELF